MAAAEQSLPGQNGLADLRIAGYSQPVAEATGQQWGLLGSGVNDVRARMLPELVAGMAEIFLINGDLNSSLYTSSKAMHSAILGLLQVSISFIPAAALFWEISVADQRVPLIYCANRFHSMQKFLFTAD